MHLKINVLVNIYFLSLSSVNKYNHLNISYIYSTEFCEYVANLVYWNVGARGGYCATREGYNESRYRDVG